ncbi:MAG: tetratricopeptide repeat protein [Proteobacteria bacterium]|nr:tetratricopeptide repeat protein [Pseudomonadota bacterium]
MPLEVEQGSEPDALFADALPPRAVAGATTSRELNPGFIGRKEAISELLTAFNTTRRSGTLSFVLVVGDPGMGKSRLVCELVHHVKRSQPGTRIAVGRGDHSGVAYSAFAKLLAQRFGITPGQGADHSQERILAGVSDVLSADRVTEVAHLLAHLMRVPLPDSPVVGPLASAPQQLETRMFIALRRFLAADAGSSPLLLALEDIELCGPETIRLLLYLASGLRGSPVLVVATARDVLFERHKNMVSGDVAIERFELGPLSGDDVVALMRELCRSLDAIPSELEAHALRLGGSPRALSELVHWLLESGIIERTEPSSWTIDRTRLAESKLPENYEELVSRRLDILPLAERGLIGKAAVIGETFWLDAVVAVVRASLVGSDRPDGPPLADIQRDGEYSRASVSSILERLVERDWIVPVDDSRIPGQREYRFVYPNLWSSVLRRIDRADRRRYHRTAAQWLEFGPQGSGPMAEEAIARHLEGAGLDGAAASRYRRAGDAARAGYFTDRAVKLYRRALDCLGDNDLVTRMDLWHDLGSLYELKGDFEAALDAIERMLRLAWVVAARPKAAVAFNKMGRVWRRKGDPRMALKYLERGVELFRDCGDERGIAGSLDDIGKVLFLLGRYDEAHENVSNGLEKRGRDGDPRSIAASLTSLGNIEQARGRFAEARRCHREALELRRGAGDRWGVISSLNNVAVLDYEHGDLGLARSGWLQALGKAEEIGALPLAALALNNLGELALREGHRDEARRRLDNALNIAKDIDERRLQVEAMRNLAELESALGNRDRAGKLAHRSHHIAREAGLRDAEGRALLCLGAVLADDAGDRSAMPTREQYFQRGVELLRELGNDSELANGLEQYGRYKRASGDVQAGERLLREALAIYNKLGLGRAEKVLTLLRDKP